MAIFILYTTSAFAQIYQYRDKNGRLHFTNEISEIPEDQQPQVLMKQPEKPAEPKEAKDKVPGQNPPEPEKATDPPAEKPQSQNPEKPASIPIIEDLNREKAALDKIHAKLMERKRDLQKEKESLKTPEQVREYRKKVTRLNNEIDIYKARNKAFQAKADAYNAAVREKGEE
ncbi:MAG: DUF4124 domain-containing protein [Deltaproteobacteria bacterium]|nr:DUF4124 domain-containing protein [Deltaproteobacteria bacterium]